MPGTPPQPGHLFSRDLDQLTNAAAYARFGVQRQRHIKRKVASANQFRIWRHVSFAARATPHLPLGSVHLRTARMSSEMVDCRRKADDARQRAAQASEPFVKSAYEKMAEHWMLLARLDSLIHDKTITNPPGKAGP